MLPALVDASEPGVRALFAAHHAEAGADPATEYGQGSFDAGGPLARGIPTVMYGASGGVGLTGDDFVPVAMVEREARVLTRLIVNFLGTGSTG
jgi:hypothetical protein